MHRPQDPSRPATAGRSRTWPARPARAPGVDHGSRHRSRPTPVQVHAGDCHMAGKRRRTISRDEARRLLTAGLRGCTHCEPDARLRMDDLGARRRPATPQLKRTPSVDRQTRWAAPFSLDEVRCLLATGPGTCTPCRLWTARCRPSPRCLRSTHEPPW
ncbi:DUF6233 domain-containing protein [Streptomyces sp. Marseille-Q5077]|uniref:DUF6233 domain-containing protein n=1 Tax=Streptomyces sp. Marseille-Q5077 TaxID=3418995 RepID=UPI003CFD5469